MHGLTRQRDAAPLAYQYCCSFHAGACNRQLYHHTPIDGGQLPAYCQVVAPCLQLDFACSPIERLRHNAMLRREVRLPEQGRGALSGINRLQTCAYAHRAAGSPLQQIAAGFQRCTRRRLSAGSLDSW